MKIILNENQVSPFYTMYSGITMQSWEKYWKNKNLLNKWTNVSSDFNFAIDYSYNFNTGEYEDLVMEISNIPLAAFMAYRKKRYKNDDDYHLMSKMEFDKKIYIIDNYELFLVDLYNHKDIVQLKLLKS